MTQEEWKELENKFNRKEWRSGKKVVEIDTYLVRDLIVMLQLAQSTDSHLKFDPSTMHLDNHEWWNESGLPDQYRIQVDMWALLDSFKEAV